MDRKGTAYFLENSRDQRAKSVFWHLRTVASGLVGAAISRVRRPRSGRVWAMKSDLHQTVPPKANRTSTNTTAADSCVTMLACC